MKKLIPVVIFCLITIVADAQTWIHAFGGRNSTGNKVIQLQDGGFLAIGSSKELMYYPTLATYIVKTDLNGIIQWQRVISTDSGQFRSICQTSNGDIFIAGNITITGAASNIAVAKLDSVGNIIWNNNYGTTLGEYGTCIVAAGNDVVIGGTLILLVQEVI